jgi:hypothetical protein
VASAARGTRGACSYLALQSKPLSYGAILDTYRRVVALIFSVCAPSRYEKASSSPVRRAAPFVPATSATADHRRVHRVIAALLRGREAQVWHAPSLVFGEQHELAPLRQYWDELPRGM